MTRSFRTEAIDRRLLIEILDLARRAPSAGNTQGVSFLALDEKKKVEEFWDISLPQPARENFAWKELVNAPVIVLPVAEPEMYVRRYGEKDKQKDTDSRDDSRDPKKWRVPYWLVDAAFAVENLLLLACAKNLGALFFGIFEREAEIKAHFQIPKEGELLGAVALGHIDKKRERPSSSLKRGRRKKEEVIRLNAW